MAEGNEVTQYDAMIRHMYETVLNHVEGWELTKKTFLICRINSDLTPVVKEHTQNHHAEQLLLMDLEQRTDLRTVTIYMNNSPCSSPQQNCSLELISFLNRHVNVYIDVYVTNLYRVRRVSCVGERHNNYSYSDESRYAIGLRNLMLHNRCRILAYNEEAWIDLLNFANASGGLRSDLLERYETQRDNHDRSRKEEDDRIRTDFLYIRSPAYVLQQPLNVQNN